MSLSRLEAINWNNPGERNGALHNGRARHPAFRKTFTEGLDKETIAGWARYLKSGPKEHPLNNWNRPERSGASEAEFQKAAAEFQATSNLLASPFQFKKCGTSGIEVREIFFSLGEMIGDICVIRSMHTDRPNHEPSLFRLNCGHPLPGHPSMGAWITYGLGTDIQNLSGFVVLCPGLPVVGPQLWTSAYLPCIYLGANVRNTEADPKKLIQYIRNKESGLAEQKEQLDLPTKINRIYSSREGDDSQLESSIQSMEIAYRMQTKVLEAFDIRKESKATRARCGDSDFCVGLSAGPLPGWAGSPHGAGLFRRLSALGYS